MKNKNGFTLIEILVVVSIVAVISTTSVILFTRTLNNTKNQSTSDLIENIELAADIYISNNTKLSDQLYRGEKNSICTKIYTLQNAGLLERNIKNPKTNKSITGTLCVYSKLDEDTGSIVHSFPLNK